MPLINVEEKKYVRVRNSNILQIYYLDFATNFWETGQMNLRLLETKEYYVKPKEAILLTWIQKL